MSTKSDQFVIHQKFFINDNLYLSTRKKEIISTIAEIFYKITNNKLKFISVEEENLKDYVTSKKQKNDDPNFTIINGIRIIKTFFEFQILSKMNLLNIFLYFCTLEIIPLAVAITMLCRLIVTNCVL